MERLELVPQSREDLETGSDAAPIQCRGCDYGDFALSSGDKPPYFHCPRIRGQGGSPFVCSQISTGPNLIWKLVEA